MDDELLKAILTIKYHCECKFRWGCNLCELYKNNKCEMFQLPYGYLPDIDDDEETQ